MRSTGLRHSGLVLVLCLLLGSAAQAAVPVTFLNPGTLGPNALQPHRAGTPFVDDLWAVELGFAAQRQDTGATSRDYSMTIPFRVEASFAGRALLFVEGSPFEAWFISPRTEREWLPTRWSGVTKADVRIGSKFLVWRGNRYFPAFAIRAIVKTTTGKGSEDHRFINAPGYLFDLVFGKRFALQGHSLEANVAAGFLAWQQAGLGQNDAPHLAALFKWTVPSGLAFRFEPRAYWGWQVNDKPWMLAAGLDVPLRPGLVFTVDAVRGMRHPIFWDARVGLRFFFVNEPASP